MSAPISLRGDYDGAGMRQLAKGSEDANQTRRLLALGLIYDGGSRGEAAALGGVGLQVMRDWVLRFNAEGPAGLIDRKPPGARPKLDAAQRAAVARMVESGPIPAVYLTAIVEAVEFWASTPRFFLEKGAGFIWQKLNPVPFF